MRYLVTGAGGWIGGYVMKELGDQAVGIDRHGRVDITLDLNDYEGFERVIEKVKPDVVLHLAARWGRVFGEDEPVETLEANTAMTMMIARAVPAETRLIYISTSEVYGHHDRNVKETDGGLAVGIYGLSKRWGEEACQVYHPDNLTIARLVMPYGPGSPPGRGRRALDTFLWQAMHRMPMTVHKGAARSWCYIDDIVDGIMWVAPRGGVWNVGRDDDMRTMQEIAERACDAAHAPHSLIEVVDPPAGQVVVKNISTQKLFDTGWRPKIDLEWGMTAVWQYVRHYDHFSHWHDEPLQSFANVADV